MAALTNIRTVSCASVGLIPLAEDPGSLQLAGTIRDYKAGRLPGQGGYLEKYQAATLELNINLVPGTDPDALNKIVDEDITVRMSDGAVYLLAQAHVEKPVDIGNGDTKLTVRAEASEKIT